MSILFYSCYKAEVQTDIILLSVTKCRRLIERPNICLGPTKRSLTKVVRYHVMPLAEWKACWGERQLFRTCLRYLGR